MATKLKDIPFSDFVPQISEEGIFDTFYLKDEGSECGSNGYVQMQYNSTWCDGCSYSPHIHFYDNYCNEIMVACADQAYFAGCTYYACYADCAYYADYACYVDYASCAGGAEYACYSGYTYSIMDSCTYSCYSGYFKAKSELCDSDCVFVAWS